MGMSRWVEGHGLPVLYWFVPAEAVGSAVWSALLTRHVLLIEADIHLMRSSYRFNFQQGLNESAHADVSSASWDLLPPLLLLLLPVLLLLYETSLWEQVAVSSPADAEACGPAGAADDGELHPEDGGTCVWICSDWSKTCEGAEQEDLQQAASPQDRSCCELKRRAQLMITTHLFGMKPN